MIAVVVAAGAARVPLALGVGHVVEVRAVRRGIQHRAVRVAPIRPHTGVWATRAVIHIYMQG